MPASPSRSTPTTTPGPATATPGTPSHPTDHSGGTRRRIPPPSSSNEVRTPMLDLEFSAEQEMLREMVAGVLAQHSPLTKVRELEDDPTGYGPALWSQLQALDLVG